MRAPTPSAAAEIVAAHEAQLCSLLATLTTNLARSMQFRIADSRTQVQELALSPAFDAVAGAFARSHDDNRSCRTSFANCDHPLCSARATQNGRGRRTAVTGQLRSAALTARTRLESLSKARDAGIVSRLETARQQVAMAAAGLMRCRR